MLTVGVAAHARADPRRRAIVAGARALTFAELDDAAGRAAAVLRARGVREGDRIGIAFRNRPEFHIAALGAARAGAAVVPVAWRFLADEMRYMVEDSGARVLLTEDNAGDAVAGLPVMTLSGFAEASARTTDRVAGDAPIALRPYTSGTTGRPKAVVRQLPPGQTFEDRTRNTLRMFGVDQPDGVHLVCGPLYHNAPLTFSLDALLTGQTVVLPERFDAADALRLIEAERVTWSFMVPIHFVRMLALPDDARARDLSSMRRILHGGAPCAPDVKRRLHALFPPGCVWEFYGTTEGRATLISPEEWERKPGSVGRAMDGVDVRVLRDDGSECARGETGVVYISGARFTYEGAPEKTAAAWRGDLFTVGDMGHLDEDGYLFLTGRAQDLVITGGANVYPAEVEAVLSAHPAVADCAVIGLPDPEWGERLHAIVEARAPVEPAELVEWCRARLAHYKCPTTVELTPELPRDPNGKVRKHQLRAARAGGESVAES